jgi:hypothetical protein
MWMGVEVREAEQSLVTVNGEWHRCKLPNIGKGPVYARSTPWECGICGRIWSVSNYGWIETRGPTREDT